MLEEDARATSSTGPSVISRVAAIMRSFTRDRPALTLTDISRSVSFPLSTVHRLVSELVDQGALERDGEGRYHVGLRLWELGNLAPRTVDLREAAMPFLGDVHIATGQNVALAVRDGLSVIYIDRLSGQRSVHMWNQVATRMPLHATGVGLALLAFETWDIRQAALSSELRAYTSRTITSPLELRKVLDAVKRSGFAVSDRQVEDVSISIAAPIFNEQSQVVAALSVVAPSTNDWRPYAPVVVAAARGISRSLDH